MAFPARRAVSVIPTSHPSSDRTWLHAQHLTLDDLRQDLLDEWLAAGATTRRAVSGFVDWLCRAQLSGRLVIAWPVAAHNPPIASGEPRLHALTALLADRRAAPTIRFAAAAVLFFAQPLTRIAALRRADLTHASAGWQLRFGRRPVQAPALLDGLLAELASSGPRRTRVAGSQSDWLPRLRECAGMSPERRSRAMSLRRPNGPKAKSIDLFDTVI